MAGQSISELWREAVRTEWDRPKLIGLIEGIQHAKPSTRRGNLNAA